MTGQAKNPVVESLVDITRAETLKAIGKVLLGEVGRINSREVQEDVLLVLVAAAGKLDVTERAPFKFDLGDVVASAYNFKADRMGVVAARGEVVDMTGNSYLVLIDNGANVWFAEDDIQPVKKDDRNVGDVTVTITTGEDLGECKNCPNCQNPGMCANPT